MYLILGIDVGLSGALAFRWEDGELRVVDTPTLTIERGRKTKREMDLSRLATMLEDHRDKHPGEIHAYVEQVGAMPGQGVTSMFAFGKSYGVVLGALAALQVPYTLVHPAMWKRAMQVPQGKDGARQRASQLLPGSADQWPLKKDHNRAEAALIAEYGWRQLSKRIAA